MVNKYTRVEVPMFKCGVCDKLCKSMEELDAHIAKAHKNVEFDDALVGEFVCFKFNGEDMFGRVAGVKGDSFFIDTINIRFEPLFGPMKTIRSLYYPKSDVKDIKKVEKDVFADIVKNMLCEANKPLFSGTPFAILFE